ncbi:hypothetical protein D3C86_1094430 [compost metagenome]
MRKIIPSLLLTGCLLFSGAAIARPVDVMSVFDTERPYQATITQTSSKEADFSIVQMFYSPKPQRLRTDTFTKTGGRSSVIIARLDEGITYTWEPTEGWVKVTVPPELNKAMTDFADSVTRAMKTGLKQEVRPDEMVEGKLCSVIRFSSPDGPVTDVYKHQNKPVQVIRTAADETTTMRFLEYVNKTIPVTTFAPPAGVAVKDLDAMMRGMFQRRK